MTEQMKYEIRAYVDDSLYALVRNHDDAILIVSALGEHNSTLLYVKEIK